MVPLQLWKKQAAFRKLYKRVQKIAGWDGPNRAGKSIAAAVIIVEDLIGIPYEDWATTPWELPKRPPGPPRHWGCITVSKGKSREAQQRYIAERIPRHWMACKPWTERTGFGTVNPKLVLTNGSTVEFFSDDQDEQNLEAAAWHGFWCDEAVAEWSFKRAIARLVDTGGKIMITAVSEAAWIYRVLRMRRMTVEDLKPAPPEFVDAIIDSTMFDNELLSEEEIERAARGYGGIESNESRMRIFGEYTHLEGVIFGEYRDESEPAGHLCPPVSVMPLRWTPYEVADPGIKNPFAWGFIGVDERGHKHLIAEIYVRGKTGAQVAELVKAKRRALGYSEPQVPAIIDPAADAAKHWGVAVKSMRAQLLEAGIRTVKGKTYGGSVDAQEQLIRAELINRTLHLATDCEWWRFEFQNYKWDDPDDETGEYLGDKEKRVDAHNHLIKALGYGLEHGLRWVRPTARAAPKGSAAAVLQQEARDEAAKRGKPWRT